MVIRRQLIAVLLCIAAGGAAATRPNVGAQQPNMGLPAAGLLVDLDPRHHVRIEPRPDLAGKGFGLDEVAVWGVGLYGLAGHGSAGLPTRCYPRLLPPW